MGKKRNNETSANNMDIDQLLDHLRNKYAEEIQRAKDKGQKTKDKLKKVIFPCGIEFANFYLI